MACNCKTNREILNLNKSYGMNINMNRSKKASVTIESFSKNLLVVILLILLFPFIILYVIYLLIFSKKSGFNVNKFIKKFVIR